MSKIEYRVRPVTRYVVTRFHENDDGGCGVETRGEYDNAHVAYEVGYALAKADHHRLGYPPGDMRIIYPEPLVVAPNGLPDSPGAPAQAPVRGLSVTYDERHYTTDGNGFIRARA